MTSEKPGGDPASESDRTGADLQLASTLCLVGDDAVQEMRRPRGPEQHKETANTLGMRTVTDLLPLSRQHDPFFKGSPAHRRDGEWFADLWRRFGFTDGVHLRRIHYRIVTSGEVITLPSGKPYLNDHASWMQLCVATQAARILGLVDVEAFVDRQNAPARIFVAPRFETMKPSATSYDEVLSPRRWSLPSIDDYTLSPHLRLDRGPIVGGYDYDHVDQPVLLELWIEKSTMSDVLLPVCSRLGINYVQAKGFESITAIVTLLRRAEAHDKPVHVFYVSDYDKAGQVMPVAVARQIEFWRDYLEIDLEVTVERLVLTPDQIERYELPGNPEKPNEVELDALEAKHPGELRTLVLLAAQQWTDVDLPARMAAAEAEAEASAKQQWDDATADLRVELRQLRTDVDAVASGYQQRLADLSAELAGEMEPFQERLDALRGTAEDLIGEVDECDLPDRPVGVVPDVDRDALLFDSRRSWLEQLAAYRAHKDGTS